MNDRSAGNQASGGGSEPVIIAVCGKGGVGKTAVSAMIIRQLIEKPDRKVLAVDADPAAGLAHALGLPAGRTVDDIRNDLVHRLENGEITDKARMLAMLDYDLLAALEERDNLGFLAVGRPEKEGCYCRVNQLLKEMIQSLAGQFDVVVIDGEAGIEQINRRVMTHVTHLLLISDLSARGIRVAGTIGKVAGNSLCKGKATLILNRVGADTDIGMARIPAGLSLGGWIPEDDALRCADMAGTSILDMAPFPAAAAVAACLNTLLEQQTETQTDNGTGTCLP